MGHTICPRQLLRMHVCMCMCVCARARVLMCMCVYLWVGICVGVSVRECGVLLTDQLRDLIVFMDKPLHDHFVRCDAGDMVFCHRWLLLSFKREFQFHEATRLFEILCSHHLELSRCGWIDIELAYMGDGLCEKRHCTKGINSTMPLLAMRITHMEMNIPPLCLGWRCTYNK